MPFWLLVWWSMCKRMSARKAILTKQKVTIVLITLMVLQGFVVAVEAHPTSQWADRTLGWNQELQPGDCKVDTNEAVNTALLQDGCSCCALCHACWLAMAVHQFSDFYSDVRGVLPSYLIDFSSVHGPSLFRPPKA